MPSAIIVATLALIFHSLWVRRDTWWTSWENSVSFALAMAACALVSMSPWSAAAITPVLHRSLGVWNLHQLTGHLCLVTAVVAIIHHLLTRLADGIQVRVLMRRHLMFPVVLGFTVMVSAYLRSDQDYQPDVFAAPTTDAWMTLYELTGGALMLYLTVYICRLMLPLWHDPRATPTLSLYLAALTFAVATVLIVAGSTWVDGDDASSGIWICLCLAVATFAHGAARSWKAKLAWYTAHDAGTAIGTQ